eukprot:m.125063 g.125063  ORF g.125063 m.125063 type:complete len:793 (+) comp12973_c0_seq1:144-2522(+)
MNNTVNRAEWWLTVTPNKNKKMRSAAKTVSTWTRSLLQQNLCLSTSSRWSSLHTRCFALTFVAHMCIQLIVKPLSVIKSDISDTNNVGLPHMGWLDFSFLLPFALVQVLVHDKMDRVGPRKMIGYSLLSGGFLMLLFGWCNGYLTYMTLLFFTGACFSVIMPACIKALSIWHTGRGEATQLGVWGSSLFCGQVLGASLAVWIRGVSGWRQVFIIPCAVTIVVGVLVVRLLRTPSAMTRVTHNSSSSATPYVPYGKKSPPLAPSAPLQSPVPLLASNQLHNLHSSSSSTATLKSTANKHINIIKSSNSCNNNTIGKSNTMMSSATHLSRGDQKQHTQTTAARQLAFGDGVIVVEVDDTNQQQKQTQQLVGHHREGISVTDGSGVDSDDDDDGSDDGDDDGDDDVDGDGGSLLQDMEEELMEPITGAVVVQKKDDPSSLHIEASGKGKGKGKRHRNKTPLSSSPSSPSRKSKEFNMDSNNEQHHQNSLYPNNAVNPSFDASSHTQSSNKVVVSSLEKAKESFAATATTALAEHAFVAQQQLQDFLFQADGFLAGDFSLSTDDEYDYESEGEVVYMEPLHRARHLSLLETFKLPYLRSLGLTYLLINMTRYTINMWMPFYFQSQHDYNRIAAAYLGSVFELGGLIGAVSISYVGERILRVGKVHTCHLSLLVAAFATLVYHITTALGLGFQIPCLLVMGAGFGGAEVLISTSIAISIGIEHDCVTSVSSLINCFGTLGAVAQAPLVAFIIRFYGMSGGVVLISAMVMLPIIALLPSRPLDKFLGVGGGMRRDLSV